MEREAVVSLDKVDCKFDIDRVTLALLKGAAKARGIRVADIMRGLADQEAERIRVAFIEAEKLLTPQGLAGELRGPAETRGKFAARAGDVVDLESAG